MFKPNTCSGNFIGAVLGSLLHVDGKKIDDLCRLKFYGNVDALRYFNKSFNVACLILFLGKMCN